MAAAAAIPHHQFLHHKKSSSRGKAKMSFNDEDRYFLRKQWVLKLVNTGGNMLLFSLEHKFVKRELSLQCPPGKTDIK